MCGGEVRTVCSSATTLCFQPSRKASRLWGAAPLISSQFLTFIRRRVSTTAIEFGVLDIRWRWFLGHVSSGATFVMEGRSTHIGIFAVRPREEKLWCTFGKFLVHVRAVVETSARKCEDLRHDYAMGHFLLPRLIVSKNLIPVAG
jgi:hypothetical protein